MPSDPSEDGQSTNNHPVLLRAAKAHWRESNQMKVLNTDLAPSR